MTAWKGLAGAVTGLVIGIVPFLVTYLPARTHHLTYAQTLGYAGRLRDVANVGGGNLLWSRVLHHFDPRMTVASENSYAVTPFVMLLVVVGGLLAVWLLRSHRAERPANAWAAAALAVATLVLCVLPLHTRFGTPWAVVWHIPGASPIRAMGRLELVTNLAAALVVVAIATEMAAKIRGARRATLLRTTGTLVLALAVLEQVNTTQGSQINRPQQLALLRSVKAPGGECRSFYVTDARQPDMPFFEFQVDAMLISQKLGMPTLNGYTAYNPPGWNLETPGGLLYPIYVSSWAAAKGLGSGVCGLDLATMTWTVGLPSGAPAGTPLPG